MDTKILLTAEEWERLKIRETIKEGIEKRRQRDQVRRMVAQKVFGLFLLLFTLFTCVNTEGGEGFVVSLILIPMGVTYIFSKKQMIFKKTEPENHRSSQSESSH